MTVVVYGKPECVQCEWTKRKLADAGVAFEYIDVTQDREAAKDCLAMDLGTQLPIVVHSENGKLIDRWAGFKLDKIKGLHGTDKGAPTYGEAPAI